MRLDGTAGEVTSSSIYETAVSNGQSALKALLILNGGAAIAFLSFMGTTFQRTQMNPEVLDYFVSALWGFILGAFAAVLSAGAIFLTNCFSFGQHVSPSKIFSKLSNLFFVLTCVIGLAAFGSFVYGGVEATIGFKAAVGKVAPVPCAPG